MQPNSSLQRLAVLLAIVLFIVLYGWLLVSTLLASDPLEPSAMISVTLPILSGALGLVLALGLGVDPTVRGATSFRDRLRKMWALDTLLFSGAVVYLLAGITGLIVWGAQGDLTPELVTVIALTVIGYLGAAVTASARPR
jgi:hypothetical protein